MKAEIEKNNFFFPVKERQERYTVEQIDTVRTYCHFIIFPLGRFALTFRLKSFNNAGSPETNFAKFDAG
jgi:hypothetical protein